MNTYAIASGLVGFSSDSLRVRVERVEGEYVFVRTADLRETAGIPLCLSADQIRYESDADQVVGWRHKDGLVTLTG